MLSNFDLVQNAITSYGLPVEISSFISVQLFYLNIFYSTMLSYVQVYFLKQVSSLFYAWANPLTLKYLYSFIINDKVSALWLWQNGSTTQAILWNYWNFFFQQEAQMCYLISPVILAKSAFVSLKLSSYLSVLLGKLITYSFFLISFLNFFFYSRYNIKTTQWSNNAIFSKFFLFFETEEEMGSLDDSLFFITIFVVLFTWYFLGTLFFTTLYSTGLIFISIGFFVLVFFVLCIPLSLLIDFGLAFASYIRGAGSSTNILVELIFDLLAVLIIFTRFIVQNIRFVLIFGAYFELFEWIYSSPYISLFNNFFSLTEVSWSSTVWALNSTFFYTLSILLMGLVSYAYYFMHLVILLFTQLGAYFMVSFWLFFFFYTSFILNKTERVFFFKRYL